jgi:ribonuclease D
MSGPAPEVVLITGATQLEAAAALWQRRPALALDTEFMRTDTFHPRLGLVQLSDGEQVWLVDPLAIADLAPLARVLRDPAVTKVLHSCSEDLEVLQHELGCRPVPLYDTQVAAAMTGHGFSLGYGALVQRLLGIELTKQETRSDWLQRPLSAAQLAYAAADVHHLFPVYLRLVELAGQLGRGSWIAEEMDRVLAQAGATTPPTEQFRRVKGGGRLDSADLAVLRELAAWRELEARRRDQPRGRIVNDAELLALVAARPRDPAALAAIDGLRPRVVRACGDALLAALERGAAVPAEDRPEASAQGPPPRAERDLIRACRDWLAERARQLSIAPELLARRVELEQLGRSWSAGQPVLPAALAKGWRRDAVGSDLLEFVRAWPAEVA